MASTRSLLVLGLCALVVCALIAETPLVEARELRGTQVDRAVVNCRSYGGCANTRLEPLRRLKIQTSTSAPQTFTGIPVRICK
jgi:hypothetical protein